MKANRASLFLIAISLTGACFACGRPPGEAFDRRDFDVVVPDSSRGPGSTHPVELGRILETGEVQLFATVEPCAWVASLRSKVERPYLSVSLRVVNACDDSPHTLQRQNILVPLGRPVPRGLVLRDAETRHSLRMFDCRSEPTSIPCLRNPTSRTPQPRK